jgi:hypothetical protein
VVAEQGLHLAAGVRSLFGQPHDQVDDADAVRTAVDEVTQEPQVGVAAGPGRLLVDQSGVGERGEQLVEVPVHVADHECRRSVVLHDLTICQARYWTGPGSV